MVVTTQHLGIALILSLLSFSPLCHANKLEEESCTESDQCSKYDERPIDNEPNVFLKPYVVGGKNVTMPTYIPPDVSTFYQEEPGSRKALDPYFPGFAVKFINLSPFTVTLYWDSGREGILFNYLPPFGMTGTASFPSHNFYLTGHGVDEKLISFTMKKGQTLYLYDAFELGHANLEDLSEEEYSKYATHKETLEFAEQYHKYTGRNWQALYPGKKLQHKMWRADYFGQEHWVETKETHFVELPPESELHPIEQIGRERRLDESEPRLLSAYRDPVQQSLNLTLKAISCAPRAFEIDNFLSEVEVHHILHLATGINLHKSKTGTSASADETSGYGEKTKTRTSRNSWVPREKSPVIDAIYRRAADLMQMDEALLRTRDEDETPDYPYARETIAENLQLVHYSVGQEYTPHHDFGYAPVGDEYQSSRFATLLLYLNDDMKGGETSFPRYINAESRDELKVTPKLGKAVLFYSYLPDGNLDDYSQHSAKPVTEGEKWLINLWTWDAVFR